MTRPIAGLNMSRLVVVAVAGGLLSAASHSQTAQALLGNTPWETIDKEPPARLIVDAPLAEPLSRGAAVIQYATENFRIVPEVGSAAVNVSPRIGHLHVTVDRTPWHWADAGTSNTIIVVGLPPGPHEILLELADPTHRVLLGKTVSFVVPKSAPQSH